MTTAATAMPPAPTPTRRGLTLGLLLLGSAGAAAAWALVAVALDRQCAWMAVVAAIDAVALLRFSRAPAGAVRASMAVAGTVLAIVLANWWVAGTQIGQMVGLLPWDSIPRLGWSYAWTLVSLANHAADLAWYAAALLIAAWAGR